MAKLQRETDVANVLSQMSQLVHQPSDNGSGINKDDQEHTYAQTLSTVNDRSSFNTSSNTVNKATVKDRKKHVCEKCGRCFSKLCNLKSHLRVHNGERPFSCDLCSKAFTNYWDLRRHCRTHSGEKPYKCSVCSRPFADFGSHRRHLRLHTNENPYKCHVCTKEFSRKDSYKNHIHTHAVKKPFCCESCGKDFAYASTYKRHLDHHSGERRYSCDVCKKSFVRHDYLASHVKVHEKRSRRDSNTSLDSEINITENELMLNTDIDRTASFSVNEEDLFPIPILLSMAESAVVNVNMCDGTPCMDSSTVELAVEHGTELGSRPTSPTSHYDVGMVIQRSPTMSESGAIH